MVRALVAVGQAPLLGRHGLGGGLGVHPTEARDDVRAAHQADGHVGGQGPQVRVRDEGRAVLARDVREEGNRHLRQPGVGAKLALSAIREAHRGVGAAGRVLVGAEDPGVVPGKPDQDRAAAFLVDQLLEVPDEVLVGQMGSERELEHIVVLALVQHGPDVHAGPVHRDDAVALLHRRERVRLVPRLREPAGERHDRQDRAALHEVHVEAELPARSLVEHHGVRLVVDRREVKFLFPRAGPGVLQHLRRLEHAVVGRSGGGLALVSRTASLR
mmetsp:Transcript_66122/g.184408  ORF Transcript_66122/g.184408 Transcript_66122/m.184408 type:complete len:272 (-) Transcript_66122:99-914(-)